MEGINRGYMVCCIVCINGHILIKTKRLTTLYFQKCWFKDKTCNIYILPTVYESHIFKVIKYYVCHNFILRFTSNCKILKKLTKLFSS